MRWFSALVVCSLGVLVQAQNFVPQQTSTRQILLLTGQWMCSRDDGRTWTAVQLPRIEDEHLQQVRYRKAIVLDSSALQRSWHMFFEGVRDAVELTVNGQYLGRYFSGGVPISVVLPWRVFHPGRNTIELVALASSDEALLQRRHQWRAPARHIGIVRSVALIASSPVFIERQQCAQELSPQQAVLRCTTSIAAHDLQGPQPYRLRIELRYQGSVVAAAEQSVSVAPERTTSVETRLQIANPLLWSPQSPALYELVVQLSTEHGLVDEHFSHVGLRRVDPGVPGKGFLMLNGEPMRLRSVVYIDQWVLGSDGTLHQPNYERDVALLQTLGVNAVYAAWEMPNWRFVQLCSQAGIAVLLDVPFGDIPSRYFEGEELRMRARNTLVRMHAAYGQEPAIVGYVLASMLDYTSKAVQEYLDQSVRQIRQSENALCYAVVAAGHHLPSISMLDGILISDLLHVPGRRELGTLLDRTLGTVQVPWALLGGAVLQPFNRGGYADPLSVEAHADYARKLFQLASSKGSSGLAIWSFSDFRTRLPLLQTNTPEQDICISGLLDTTRQRRLAFEMVRALYVNETEPLLQAGSYDAGTPYVFLASGMGAIVLLFWLINRSRRFREYLARSFVVSTNFFMDIRDHRILLQGQTLLLSVVIACIYALVVATLLYGTRLDPAADYLSSILAVWQGAKALYIQLAWSPALALTVVLLLVLTGLMFTALVVRIVAHVAHRMVMFSDAVMMVVWAFVPIVLFLPVAMVLFRMLGVTPPWVWGGLLAAVTVWGWLRLLGAAVIVFEAPAYMVYLAGIGGIVLIVAGVLLVLQAQEAILSYLWHFWALFFP